MKTRIFLCGMLVVAGMAMVSRNGVAANAPKPLSDKKFDALAASALEAMKQKAAELNIQGVAVVSYAPGDSVQGWSSKMAVVGHMTDLKASANGNNLLGIAYAKSSEMARTLKDSGTAGGAPMTGEFGWQGGVIFKTSSGFVIVAFSGGKSEDDVQVSKAGLEVMKKGLS
ncbi:MAG: hypothetical protein ACLPY1_10290 [Terracidiphilus sp.]